MSVNIFPSRRSLVLVIVLLFLHSIVTFSETSRLTTEDYFVSCSEDSICDPVLRCEENLLAYLNPKCYGYEWSSFRKTSCLFDTDEARVQKRLHRLLKNLKGQDELLKPLEGLIRLKVRHPDSRLNLHFAGYNGLGKTFLAKIISIALSRRHSLKWTDAGDVLYQIDLSEAQHLDENATSAVIRNAARAIEDQIAAALSECPRAVILIDELESIHPGSVYALTRALKGEPIRGVPTKSATFILTSDFGSQGNSRGKTLDQMREFVENFSAQIYADKTLYNYVKVFPFQSLNPNDFLAIIQDKFRKLPCKHENLNCVWWNSDAESILLDASLGSHVEKNGRVVEEKFDTMVDQILAADIPVNCTVDAVVKGLLPSKVEVVVQKCRNHNSEGEL